MYLCNPTACFLTRLLALCGLLLGLSTAPIFAAEPEPVSREEAKATFIFKIFLNMTWPKEETTGRFRIAIYGKDQALTEAMEDTFRGIHIRGKPVEIETLRNLDKAGEAHALVIASRYNVHLKSIAEKLRQTQTLLITEGAEDKRNVMINFVDTAPNRLGFEVNRSSILYEGLVPSKNILLFGGTELDIAFIHKETEAELAQAQIAVEHQRQELNRQQALLKEQLNTIANQRASIDKQLAQIADQHERINKQQQQIRQQSANIQEKEAELAHLETSLDSIKTALSESEDILTRKESVLAKKEADIDFYSEQIMQNLDRLKQQKLEIQGQEEQIAQTNAILSEQLSIIRNQRLILVAAVGALLTFCGLIIIIYRGSRENLHVNKVLEHKTAELESANEQLLQMSEAKSQFLSTMSHEIRTPLNGVLGMVELLRYTPIDKQQHQYLDTIYSSGELLLAVINDVLDYSKIEAGKMTIEQVEFDLEKVITDCAPVFAQRTTPELAFTVEVAEGTPVHLMGDPTRIRQVLLNLLSNAFKFTASGEIKVTASALPPEPGEQPQYAIAVSDTGVGLSEAQCEHIFQAFTQADASTTRRYGGTGLGLTISMRLARLMGGTIGLESQEGKGSTFTLKLPLVPARPRAEPSVQPARLFATAATSGNLAISLPDSETAGAVDTKSGNGAPTTAGATLQFPNANVLVVEDNAVNQMVIKGFLNKLGIKPQFANNGREAVDRYLETCTADSTAQAYDLILMDCEMPEMDGFTATGKIRELENEHGAKKVSIVALTAHAMEAQRQQALDAGMDEHLAKPVRLSALQTMLARFLTP